jgi:general secretion pathway protein M
MTSSLPGGPRGRVLAVGLAIAVAVTLWFGIADPLIAWHARRAELLIERQNLARHMAHEAGRLADLKQQIARANASGPPALALLEGETDAIAGATLQGVIQDMAQKSGAALTSAEMLPAEQIGDYRRIGVRVAVFAQQWPIMVRLLEAIEQSTPEMLVDDLQIRGLALRHKQDGPAVDASFTVFAFRHAPTPKGAG